MSTITIGVDLAKHVFRCARWTAVAVCCAGWISSGMRLLRGWRSCRPGRWWRRRRAAAHTIGHGCST